MLKLCAVMQKGKLVLEFDKSNKLFSKFVERTNISNLVFEPSIFALSPAF